MLECKEVKEYLDSIGLPTVNKNFHKIHQNLTKFTSTIL